MFIHYYVAKKNININIISRTKSSSEGNFTGEGWNSFCDGAAIPGAVVDRATKNSRININAWSGSDGRQGSRSRSSFRL
eukprot:scaffold72265_cov28-Cyclotella_meneghiniana.AAC.1